MKQIFISILLFALTGFAAHVAVLETIGAPKTLDLSERQYLTDKLRQIAVTSLSNDKGFTIMTRENINAMLPPGKSIEECEGSCLVETGKNISADYVAQARVSKFDKLLTITVELYETASGKLMASYTGESSNAKGLLNEIERKSGAFFSVINDSEDKVKDGDGNIYKTIQIGNLIWMAENLNIKTENSWCYDNKPENCKKYGRLYSWNAAKKICPTGFRLPSKDDFKSLIESVKDSHHGWNDHGLFAGKKLKSQTGWEEQGYGSDPFGFSALAAGYKNKNGFEGIGNTSAFWSSDEFDENHTSVVFFASESDGAFVNEGNKNSALSVRCVQGPSVKTSSPAYGSIVIGSKKYKTVKIGSQTWMAENLNLRTKNSWCYENKSEFCTKYGRLYSWEDSKSACPIGWRLPRNEDFENLFSTIGDNMQAETKLKSKNDWEDFSYGQDIYGFSVLPAGIRKEDGLYEDKGYRASFWTSTINNYSIVITYEWDYSTASIGFATINEGHSIRCIKD